MRPVSLVLDADSRTCVTSTEALTTGAQLDGTFRRHAKGRDIGALSWLGTFAQYGTVQEDSLVKIDDDLPLDRACLVGCGVTTGWGSAVHTADVAPGDTVVVIGCGGIGSAAIQGARLAGAEKIVAVDIVEAKRDKAFEMGATHFATSIEEATALVGELTRGVMADSALLTVGLIEGTLVVDALNIIRKGGAVVVTAIASLANAAPALPMAVLGMATLYQKRLLGSLYGEANPRADIPRLLSLYREGKLAARRDGHHRVQARRHQRRVRRHAGRPQHSRRRHPRPLTGLSSRRADAISHYFASGNAIPRLLAATSS